VTIIIIGSGPSMKPEYIDMIRASGLPSMGMNAQYRHYETIDWLPQYYCCFDVQVGENHKEKLTSLDTHLCSYREVGGQTTKGIPPDFKNQSYHYVTTGTCAVRWAMELGYKRIILTGIDCDYQDLTADKELVEGTWGTWKLKETPKENPNYWVEDYQQEGDVYNTPNYNPSKPYHPLAWLELAAQSHHYGVQLIQTGSLLMPTIPVAELPQVLDDLAIA